LKGGKQNNKFMRRKRINGIERSVAGVSESSLAMQDYLEVKRFIGLTGEGSFDPIFKDAEEEPEKGVTQQEQKYVKVGG
jgi:hypothetical protein